MSPVRESGDVIRLPTTSSERYPIGKRFKCGECEKDFSSKQMRDNHETLHRDGSVRETCLSCPGHHKTTSLSLLCGGVLLADLNATRTALRTHGAIKRQGDRLNDEFPAKRLKNQNKEMGKIAANDRKDTMKTPALSPGEFATSHSLCSSTDMDDQTIGIKPQESHCNNEVASRDNPELPVKTTHTKKRFLKRWNKDNSSSSVSTP